MKKVSAKQAQRNAILAKIKKTKPDVCIFCQTSCSPYDGLCHLLPKSIYGQYYLELLNLWKGHTECHARYDNGSQEYRLKFPHIISLVRSFASRGEIYRYFGI